MCLSHGQVMFKIYMSELNFYLSQILVHTSIKGGGYNYMLVSTKCHNDSLTPANF